MDTMTRSPVDDRKAPPPRRKVNPAATIGLVVLALVVALFTWAVLTPRSYVPASTGTQARPVEAPAAASPPDWPSIVASIAETDHRLRLNPDPSKLATYMTADNPQFSEAVMVQGRLADRSWRYDPAPTAPTIGVIEVISADSTTASLTLFFSSTPRYRVVDRAGTVIADQSAGVGYARWDLRLEGGQWKLARTAAL